MRFLVTGGAGFIGSHLVEQLCVDGHDVLVLDDFSTGSLANLSAVDDRFELLEGSVADPETCARAVRGVDYVLHQAALGSVPLSLDNPVRTHEVCATGTLNLLIAARDAGVRRFVYAGSSSAYGDTPELPKHEGIVPEPRSPYAASKLAGEGYCQAFSRSCGLETVSLRYFNVFGPRQDPSSQYAAVIPLWITAACSGDAPTIFGDGEQTRDFIFVSDVVRANLLACWASADAVGQVFNVGRGERVSLNRLWVLIRELTGAAIQPTRAPVRTGDVRDSWASLDRTREVLGFEPLVSFEAGLERTVSWLSPLAWAAAARAPHRAAPSRS